MIYQSGTPTAAGAGQIFSKDLQIFGQVTSAAAGSYAETAITREVWAPDAPVQVLAVIERHSVLGSTLGMLVKATGSTPLGSGSNVLSGSIDHTSAVDVVNSGTIYNSTTLNQATLGDAFGWRWSIGGAKPPEGKVTLVLQYL